MKLFTLLACVAFSAACTHAVSGPSEETPTDRESFAALPHDDNLEHWIAVKSTVQSYELVQLPATDGAQDPVMVAPLIRLVETSTSARFHIDTVDTI